MPRKRVLAKQKEADVFKNPLVQAFGLLLKELRKKYRLQVEEDVAHDLGISISTYRLIESGAVAIPSHCTFQLIQIFGFEWKSLTDIIATIHVMDRHYDSLSRMRGTLANISVIYPRLRWLEEALRPVWQVIEEKKDLNDVSEVLHKTGVVDKLHNFLMSPSVYNITASANEWCRLFVEDTPPVYLDLIEMIIGQLRLFPPHVAPTGLAEWEHRNSSRIREVYALMKDHRQLPKSYDQGFDWDFLYNKENPPKVRIICLEDKIANINARQSFENLIIKLYKKRKMEHEPDILIQVAVEKRNELEDLLSPDLTMLDFIVPVGNNEKRIAFNNIWLYKLGPYFTSAKDPIQFKTGPNIVAFMDKSTFDAKEAYAIPCSWKYTHKLLESLERFWSDRVK